MSGLSKPEFEYYQGEVQTLLAEFEEMHGATGEGMRKVPYQEELEDLVRNRLAGGDGTGAHLEAFFDAIERHEAVESISGGRAESRRRVQMVMMLNIGRQTVDWLQRYTGQIATIRKSIADEHKRNRAGDDHSAGAREFDLNTGIDETGIQRSLRDDTADDRSIADSANEGYATDAEISRSAEGDDLDGFQRLGPGRLCFDRAKGILFDGIRQRMSSRVLTYNAQLTDLEVVQEDEIPQIIEGIRQLARLVRFDEEGDGTFDIGEQHT